mmetsp:Transcript_29851/g.68873  ORF Transcript_29851/g.68873 Transcript_29851/m.68873 type:complete len:215 (+) Transcript_29851:153-797(+)
MTIACALPHLVWTSSLRLDPIMCGLWSEVGSLTLWLSWVDSMKWGKLSKKLQEGNYSRRWVLTCPISRWICLECIRIRNETHVNMPSQWCLSWTFPKTSPREPEMMFAGSIEWLWTPSYIPRRTCGWITKQCCMIFLEVQLAVEGNCVLWMTAMFSKGPSVKTWGRQPCHKHHQQHNEHLQYCKDRTRQASTSTRIQFPCCGIRKPRKNPHRQS